MGGSKFSVPGADPQSQSQPKVLVLCPVQLLSLQLLWCPRGLFAMGGEEQLAALCEVSAFSQDTHCLSAASASTLLVHSAVADASLIKEEKQFEFSFSFLNPVSNFHQSL